MDEMTKNSEVFQLNLLGNISKVKCSVLACVFLCALNQINILYIEQNGSK